MIDHNTLMQGLSVQHLRFTVQPQESIVFSSQPGSALRGALYQVLSDNFCSEPDEPITPDHQERCPVCWLLAAENAEAERGQNISRPLTVEPPLQHQIYHAGQHLTFGFSLVGQAQNLLPYIARAVQKMGSVGVGKGRGRFKLINIAEVNPLWDAERVLLDGHRVKAPTLQVTPARVDDLAASLNPHRITLEFLTPLRLIADKRLVKTPDLPVLIARLLERCQSLVDSYAEVPQKPSRDDWYAASKTLQSIAETITIAYNDTEWVEEMSGSRRQGRATPISGLAGSVRYEGDLTALLPWLVWGASLHVGKSAVKGNGWYRIVS